MNYVTELLEEQKELLTEEIRFAEGEELEQTKQRMTDVVDALNKLPIADVSKSVNCDYCKDLGRKYAGVTLGHTKCPECGKH